jgi:O-antigen/teichoic acid export membrane protein
VTTATTAPLQSAESSRYRGQILVLSAGRVMNAVIALATTMVVTRLLSRAEYGTYRMVWLTYDLLLPFLTLGLPASVTYFVPLLERRKQAAFVLQTAVLLGAAGVAIGLAGYLLSGPVSHGFQNHALAQLLTAFLLFPAFSLPLLCVDSLLVATGHAAAAAWVNIGSAVLHFVSLVVPLWAGASLKVVMWSLTGCAALRLLVIVLYVGKMYAWTGGPWTRTSLGEQLRYSLPLATSGILGTLTQQLDRLVIAFLFGPIDYALYANGATEVPLVSTITGSVMTVVTPEFVRLFARGEKGRIVQVWNDSTRLVASLFIPLAAFLWVFAEETVVFLFSAKYRDCTPLFRTFLLLLPLRITNYGSVLMASGNSKLILSAAVRAVVCNAVLLCILVPTLGLLGAAIAAVGGVYYMGGWQLWRTSKVLDTPVAALFPWRSLALITGASAIAAALSALAVTPIRAEWLRLACGAGIFGFFTLPLAAVHLLKGGNTEALRKITGRLLRVSVPPSGPGRTVLIANIDAVKHKNLYQIEGLSERGYSFVVVTQDSTGVSRQIVSGLPSVRVFAASARWRRLWFLFTVSRVLASTRIDLAELYPDSIVDLLIAAIIKTSHVPLVLIARGPEFSYIGNQMSAAQRMAFRLTYRLADYVIYKELYMPRLLEAFGKHRIALLSNAVGVPASSRRHEAGTCTFLFMNTLKAFRHPEVCLAAFLRICERRHLDRSSPIRLLIVGLPKEDGDAHALRKAKALRDTAVARDVPVELHEWTNEPNTFFDRADVFLLPADVVYLNYALIEAMARGIPAILQDAPGADLIVTDGEEGYVAPLSVDAWEAQMERMLDSGLRQTLGRNAREKVKRRFSAPAYVAGYERIYDEILSTVDE